MFVVADAVVVVFVFFVDESGLLTQYNYNDLIALDTSQIQSRFRVIQNEDAIPVQVPDIDGDDLDAYGKKVVDAGGKIVVDKMEVPGGGHFTLFEDPDGIRLEMNHVPGKGLLA